MIQKMKKLKEQYDPNYQMQYGARAGIDKCIEIAENHKESERLQVINEALEKIRSVEIGVLTKEFTKVIGAYRDEVIEAVEELKE